MNVSDDKSVLNKNVVLHLGSNIGDRKKNLLNGIELIKVRVGSIETSSAIYQTSAWGNVNQRDFYNKSIVISTLLSPDELLNELLLIEAELGRIRKGKWEERLIDIDIIFYNDMIVEKDNLIIPHPLMHERMFVLVPVSELIPEFMHPVLKIEISQLLNLCIDNLDVHKI